MNRVGQKRPVKEADQVNFEFQNGGVDRRLGLYTKTHEKGVVSGVEFEWAAKIQCRWVEQGKKANMREKRKVGGEDCAEQ